MINMYVNYLSNLPQPHPRK